MKNHRRGPWSQAEDSRLLQLVNSNGPSNWVRISQEIETRSPKQCRERFHQNLKLGLNHGPITAEEGHQIENLVNTIGKRWAEIARRMPGRSDNAVKNWWNGGQNRRKRQSNRNHQDDSHIQRPVQQSSHLPQFDPQGSAPRIGSSFTLPLPLPTPSFSLPSQLPNHPGPYSHGVAPSIFSTNPMYAPRARPEPLDLVGGPPRGFSMNSFHNHNHNQNHYPTPAHSPSLHSNRSSGTPSLGSEPFSNSPHASIGRSSMTYDNRGGRRSSGASYLPTQTNGFGGANGCYDGFPNSFSNSWGRPPPAAFGHGADMSFNFMSSHGSNIAPQPQVVAPQVVSSPPGMRVGNILNGDNEASNSRGNQHDHQQSQPASPTGHPSPPKDSRMEMNRFT